MFKRLFVILQGELQQMKVQLEETKQCVDGQKAEQQKLQKIIADADAQHVQQKKQMEQVKSEKLWCREERWQPSPLTTDKTGLKVGRERDNLAKQLLHRNEERKLLYEKIKIQQSILSKGDFHYKERMEDIHLLKLQVKRLQRKKSILDKTVPNTEDLR